MSSKARSEFFVLRKRSPLTAVAVRKALLPPVVQIIPTGAGEVLLIVRISVGDAAAIDCLDGPRTGDLLYVSQEAQ